MLPATFSPVTMSTGIRTSLVREPGKVAILCDGRSLTYAALVRRIDQVAQMAVGLGLKPGDRAAILAENCLEYIEIVDGLADAGIATATVNPKQTALEIQFILNDCGARIAFATPRNADLLREVDCPALERVVAIGPEYEAMLAEARPATLPSVAEWDAFSIPYTSGTTGKPRGVVLPHRSRALVGLCMASEYGCYGPDDRFLAITPLFHGAGFSFAHAAVFFGGTVEILTGFEPEAVLRRIHAGGITGTFMVPTIFHAIFALERSLLDACRGHRLRALMSNAAPLPQRTKEVIVDYFGDGLLHEIYGSTEGGIVCNLRPRDQLRKQQCVGHAFTLNQVCLLDEAGTPVKQGEVGELFNTSPCLFLGYWNNPEATRAAMRGNWFSAGDLAWQDADGCYYIVDRKKDMYISGGQNVYPREIEEFLFRQPGIQDAAVVGVPDDYWGEVGCAFLVRRPGSDLNAAEILAACKANLAGFKVPRQVEFIDLLPRNAAGKVLKTELRRLHAARHNQQGGPR